MVVGGSSRGDLLSSPTNLGLIERRAGKFLIPLPGLFATLLTIYESVQKRALDSVSAVLHGIHVDRIVDRFKPNEFCRGLLPT